MKKLFLICAIAVMSANIMAFSINVGGKKADEQPAEKTDLKATFKNMGKNLEKEAKASLAKNIDGTSIGTLTTTAAQMNSQLKNSKERKAFTKNLSTCKAALMTKAIAQGLKGDQTTTYMLKELNGKDVAAIEKLAKELKVVTIENDIVPIEVNF